MRKEIFVVRVGNYMPALCRHTLPSIKRYAKKIGAKFTLIRDRKFPEFSPTYEKMQVFDRGKDNDWNILLDCDMYLDEGMYDVTEIVSEDTVGSWMVYDPQVTIQSDEYLRLDGSDKIIATNFVVSGARQHSIWKPLEFSAQEALSRMKRSFVVDEYCVGRNIKRLGIGLSSISLPGAADNLFVHCNASTDALSEKEALQLIPR